MKSQSHSSDELDPASLAAAEWVLRHDRGLTAAEQDAFSQWLSADPRHRTAWAEHRWGWDELDRLVGLHTSVHALPNPDLLAPKKSCRLGIFSSPRLTALSLVAAGFMLGLLLWERLLVSPQPREGAWSESRAPHSLALIEQRELADGSVVELNRGAVVTEHFTSAERRMRLERGEAHFKVAKNPTRPFVVEVAGVAVRAVGTAFSVRLDQAAVDVLVTEGKVKVNHWSGDALVAGSGSLNAPGASRPQPESDVLLSAGQSAVLSLASTAMGPQVAALSSAEIETRLAWQPRLLNFTNASLPEIIAEFNRCNPVRLTLGDAPLGRRRLSATFRSDNVEGFVRLMVSDFGMRAERRGDGEVVLRSAP